MKLAFTKEAKFDLGDIGDWIADQDPVRADTIIDELTARCAKLPGMPAHIRWYPLRGNSTIRRVVHGHYLIFYRVTADVVEILRVLHGARDVESILFPDTKKRK